MLGDEPETFTYDDGEPELVVKTMRETLDRQGLLDQLEGQIVNKTDFNEDGNLIIYFNGTSLTVNYSCMGGVFISSEEV